MLIQPLDVLGGIMLLAGLMVVTSMVTFAVAPEQRLGAGASLMMLGITAAAGPCMY